MEKKTFELKPEKAPFVYYDFLQVCLVSLAILLIAVVVLVLLNLTTFIPYPILFVLLLNLIYYLHLSVKYKKTLYIFKGNRIVMRGGSFFSDYETELVIQKVTQVAMTLPFLEHLIFKTGSIDFKAAGSSDTEISLAHIKNPNEMYKSVVEIMEENGFSLKRDDLLQQETPSVLGMIIYNIFALINAMFVMLLVFWDINFQNLLNFIPLWAWLLIISTIILTITLAFVYHYMKIKRTTYYLYNDMIEYSEVFMTKRYSFIPIENLANCDIEQNFWQKLLHLYNVKLSSQGSQNDISFTMIKNGTRMRNHISQLIEKTPSLADVKDSVKEEQTATQDKEETINQEIENKGYTNVMQMNFWRSISLNLIAIFMLIAAISFLIIITTIFVEGGVITVIISIPLFLYAAPVFIFYLVYQYIIVNYTKFKINRESMSQEFSFLTSQRREFSIDKITSVILKENIIDRWFNTITVVFTSIGSSQNITFSHINKDSEIIENILLKNNFQEEEIKEKLQSEFSFREMLKGNLFLFVFLIPLLIATAIASIFFPIILALLLPLLLLSAIVCFYRRKYYRYSKITFYDSYVHFKRGWLFKQEHYALYSNIKDLISMKYPLSEKGRITFNVAGENFMKNPDNQNKELNLVSSGFTVNYIPKVRKVHDNTELFLNKFPFNSKTVNTSKPDLKTNLDVFKPVLGNSLFILILSSIILVPLIAFLPFTVPATIIMIKRVTYRIQPERVIKDEGVFFRKKTSILHNRINHITKHQGFLNKVFSNGSLAIYTVGSGMPELVIKNVKRHNEIYSKFEKFYR